MSILGCDAVQTMQPDVADVAERREGRGPRPNGSLKGAALLVGDVIIQPGDAVRRYDGNGRLVDAMVPDGTAGLTVPCCITFGPDEHLYVSSPFTGEVFRFNGVTGEFIDVFIAANSGGLVVPLALVFHGDHLYVGDLGAHGIRRYDAETGAFIDEFVPAGSFGLGELDPQHFAFGPDGNLYVAAHSGGRVLRYDGGTGALIDEFMPINPDIPDPDGLTFGPDGRLYVGSNERSTIWRFDIATGAGEEFIPPGSGGLSVPVGFTFGPDGNLYVTSLNTSQILAYDGRTGTFIGPFVDTGVGGLRGPRTVAFKATITMCHRPPGNPARGKTLRIAYLDGLDHAAHGDEVGSCS